MNIFTTLNAQINILQPHENVEFTGKHNREKITFSLYHPNQFIFHTTFSIFPMYLRLVRQEFPAKICCI